MRWLVLLLVTGGLFGAEWRAGVATVDITPPKPIWLAGFAARTKPSEGVLAPIHAKALVLEDRTGARTVLVTADILGFTDRISEAVTKRLGIARERIAFNGSHTHWGPVIDRQLQAAYPMTPEQWRDVDDYSASLIDKVADVVKKAEAGMRPATLKLGKTEAGFAVNFRMKTDKGYVHKPNPSGVVDRSVPVLRIEDSKGTPFAIVFGYSCHPTVATGNDVLYQVHGDYAGFAQALLEKQFPGATALFVQGFGGDAKADPRGTIELARKHGAELAGAVASAAATTVVHGPLHAVFGRTTLTLRPAAPREEWERRAQSTNGNIVRNARVMLNYLDTLGRIPVDYPYPMQIWKFGRDLTMVILGGETLIDYAIRLRKELPATGAFWPVGYSNDVSCYIPPVRVLREGGYEPDESMIYYARPGPFEESIEERIIEAVKSLAK